MTDTPELKPCPFCGGEAEAINYIVEAVCSCAKCRATITRQHGHSEDNGLLESITAWNTRSDHAQALVAAAFKAAAEIIDERHEARAIRALTPADAVEALDAAKAEAYARITALEVGIQKALERLEASKFTNAEHMQAADILRAALAGGE